MLLQLDPAGCPCGSSLWPDPLSVFQDSGPEIEIGCNTNSYISKEIEETNLTPQGATPLLPSMFGEEKVSGGGRKPGKVHPSTSWSEHCQPEFVTRPSFVEARIPSGPPTSLHSIANTLVPAGIVSSEVLFQYAIALSCSCSSPSK